MEFYTIEIFHAKTTEKGQERSKICEFPAKKDTNFMRFYYELSNNSDQGRKVELEGRISCSLNKLQVLRKVLKFESFILFYYFNIFLP